MTRDLTLFGGAGAPLRASSLPLLVRCPWRAVMLHLNLLSDATQYPEAADTGSAIHAAVHYWHTHGKEVDAALRAMHGRVGEYPLAKMTDVDEFFRLYCRDRRNLTADVVLAEAAVSFSIAPAEDDPTRAPIVINGRLDQVRRVNGQLKLFDLKHSSSDGPALTNDFTYQAAAYCVGATQLLGEPVHPGAIIRTRGYPRPSNPKRKTWDTEEPNGVFFEFAWRLSDADSILDGVRRVVSSIRAGAVWIGPGPHCSNCPALGVSGCLEKLRTLTT